MITDMYIPISWDFLSLEMIMSTDDFHKQIRAPKEQEWG